jgi:predicted nucleic acid-binding protein
LSAYADSSFVASLYLRDIHSERAAAWMATFHEPVSISPLVILEVTNASGLRAFRDSRAQTAAREALTQFESDLAGEVFVHAPVTTAAWSLARRLSETHTRTTGAISLDILHVACALQINSEFFLTFDRIQARLARAEGLATPVEIP